MVKFVLIKKVADKFNNFFTSIASKLVEKMSCGPGKYTKDFFVNFYREKNVKLNEFSLSIVSEKEVLKVVNSIGVDKATGLDNFAAKFLKDGVNKLIEPLTHVINLSIHSGVVPEDLKTARVVPLYKKNDKTDPGNYRPVSILNIVSKILERLVYNKLQNYLTEKQLLYEFQSGFRTSFSTDTCLLHLTDYIRLQTDQGNYTGMVLLDLQKPFDTVDHTILLDKLKAMGLNDTGINWFHSYLTDRSQFVNIGDTMSSPGLITCGVPQGSILGPLLFLVYVNDMVSAVKCKLLLYADDSALLVSGKDITKIEKELGSELEAVSDWLRDNKLTFFTSRKN